MYEGNVAVGSEAPPPAQGMRVIVEGGRAADISATPGADPPLYLTHDLPRDRKGGTRVGIYDDHASAGPCNAHQLADRGLLLVLINVVDDVGAKDGVEKAVWQRGLYD